MPSNYCIHCGQPTSYKLQKPKFCSNCSKPFDASGIALQKQVRKEDSSNRENSNQNKAPTFIIAQEEEIPQIKKLELVIHKPQIHRETIGNIWGTGREPATRAIPESKGKFNKQQFFKDWKSEAGGTARLELGGE